MCRKYQKEAGNLTQIFFFFTSLTCSMLEWLQLSLVTLQLYYLSVLCLQNASSWFVLSVAVCGPEWSLQLSSVLQGPCQHKFLSSMQNMWIILYFHLCRDGHAERNIGPTHNWNSKHQTQIIFMMVSMMFHNHLLEF